MTSHDTPKKGDRYEEIYSMTHREVEETISQNELPGLSRVPIAVSLFDNDFEWAQRICIGLACHPDPNVRGNAVLSFGHLARRFRNLNLEEVEPLYRAALEDPDEYVSSQAADILDEIQHHLKLASCWPF